MLGLFNPISRGVLKTLSKNFCVFVLGSKYVLWGVPHFLYKLARNACVEVNYVQITGRKPLTCHLYAVPDDLKQSDHIGDIILNCGYDICLYHNCDQGVRHEIEIIL